MSRRIEFWFDYLSHNAYLAWCAARPLAGDHDAGLIPEPPLCAGLLQPYGGKGPAEVPAKNQWMLKNVLRKAHRENIPIAPPASHPFNPLLALRSTLAIEVPAQRSAFVDALFRGIWAESKDPNAPATLQAAALAAALDAERLAAAAPDPDIKDQLHAQTRRAIGHGIFGVPTLRCGEELFWGFDDLPFLALHLAGKDPLPGDALRGWSAVRPSAQRR